MYLYVCISIPSNQRVTTSPRGEDGRSIENDFSRAMIPDSIASPLFNSPNREREFVPTHRFSLSRVIFSGRTHTYTHTHCAMKVESIAKVNKTQFRVLRVRSAEKARRRAIFIFFCSSSSSTIRSLIVLRGRESARATSAG